MDKYGLVKWQEFGAENAPSIRILFSKKPYPNKEKIASYLESGETKLVSPEAESDVVTGNLISPCITKCIKSNGDYSWSGILPYYVREYNLRLPAEYEEDILERC